MNRIEIDRALRKLRLSGMVASPPFLQQLSGVTLEQRGEDHEANPACGRRRLGHRCRGARAGAARLSSVEDIVYYGTTLRGASNQKAKKTFDFEPRRLEWLGR